MSFLAIKSILSFFLISASTFARSSLTLFGKSLNIFDATVPFRLEYGKICKSEKPIFLIKLTVSVKFSSVSVGKPTMTSVVMPASGKYFRIKFTVRSKSAVRYFLFIFFKTSSHPLCKERWKCGQKFLRFFKRLTKSSLIKLSSIDESLRRNPNLSSASKRSISLVPFLSQYEETSIPTSTTSLTLFGSFSISAITLFASRERLRPRR